MENIVKGLEKITAQQITPTSLAESANLFGRTRELQRELSQIRRVSPGLIRNRDFYAVIKAGFFLPRAVYNRMLEDLLEKLKPLTPPQGKRPRIVISGLVFDLIDIFSTLDELQVDVEDDDFANGWRTVSKKTLQTDNLVDKAKKAEADGVLFWYINFCEPDAFDAPLFKERLKKEGIPVSSIDVELTMTNFDGVKTRLNAFSEILEG